MLLVPPKPARVALPWLSPADRYDPTQVMPFATNRYLNILRGNASRAWEAGKVEKETLEAIEEARRPRARRRHPNMAAVCHMPTPDAPPDVVAGGCVLPRRQALLRLRSIVPRGYWWRAGADDVAAHVVGEYRGAAVAAAAARAAWAAAQDGAGDRAGGRRGDDACGAAAAALRRAAQGAPPASR